MGKSKLGPKRRDRRHLRYRQPPTDVDTEVKVIDAILAVGYLATSEAARPHPDQEIIRAVQTVGAAVIAPPHVVLHLWAGGVEPGNPDVRGTVSYFNELAVDPAFWMLHTELDRWWYTWEQTHTGLPPLSGEDAQFQPLTSQEGAWYGGGRVHSLSDLAPTRSLPYRYAARSSTERRRRSVLVRHASPLRTAWTTVSAPSGPSASRWAPRRRPRASPGRSSGRRGAEATASRATGRAWRPRGW